MRVYKREEELREIAESLSVNIKVNADDRVITRKATKKQHDIMYGLIYGALLGLNWGEGVRSDKNMEQAILDATEFQSLILMSPTLKDRETFQSYTSLYIPLQNVLREWEQRK